MNPLHSLSNIFNGISPQQEMINGVTQNDAGLVEGGLQRGADPNIPYPISEEENGFVLITAASQGQLSAVQILLRYRAEPNLIDAAGATALYRAVEKGNLPITRLLLASGADPDRKANNGVSPIIFAAFNGNYEVVEVLLQYKADPNSLNLNEVSALYWAMDKGYPEIARLLLENGADPNQRSEDSGPVLSYAAYNGNLPIAEILLAHNADPNSVNGRGESALFWAGKQGHIPVVEALLTHGADPNKKNPDGDSPLNDAAFRGDLKLVETLLKYNAEPDIVNAKNASALHWAANEGHLPVVTLLLQRGADPNHVSNNGSSPLLSAAFNGHNAVVDTLLQYNANPNIANADGTCVLQTMVNNQNIPIIRSLLEKGADPDRKSTSGVSPLIGAAYDGNTEIVELLLKYKANPNIANIHGVTPLSWAAEKGHVAVAQLLLKYGADRSHKNKSGYTPLEVAQQNKQEGVIQLLQNSGTSPETNATPQTTSQTATTTSTPAPSDQDTLESLLAELDRLTGLAGVKADVSQMVKFLQVQKMRRERGLSVPKQSLHMVFTGNPGTGKTTVARLIGRIYKQLGVLSKGHFVETDRAGLVAGYIGQTAIRVKELVEQALGGILFIDEAYALAPENATSNDYGQEAINTLLKMMEDHRDDLIVIVAGYTAPMKKFMRSNPGLQSRFNKAIQFDDYSPAELAAIFQSFGEKEDYKLTPETAAATERLFKRLYEQRDETFGNARSARNLFEAAINNQAIRVMKGSSATPEDLVTLLPEDIPGQSEEKEADMDSLIAELNEFIGLAHVKAEVLKTINFLRVQQMRRQHGITVPEQSLHMVFSGAPGTGKTTVARLLGHIYRELDVLSKGHFIEVDRASLVAGYIGQTAIKTQEMVQSALGGILFIDEAYTLTGFGNNDFGQEAVNTLLKMMEDHRGNLIVIVAGYTERMKEFLDSNPGLQSRFNKEIVFEDYSPEEMAAIFDYFARNANYIIPEQTQPVVRALFEHAYQDREENFGNGRYVRNEFEKAINNQATRLATQSAVNEESLKTLLPEDIPVHQDVVRSRKVGFLA